MRSKLISYIIELSKTLYNDDLSWMDFNKYSNDDLLYMYAKLSIDEYVMNTLKGIDYEKQ